MRHLNATVSRLRREEQSRRFHTWHLAALSRPTAKMPSFDEFLKPVIEAKPAPHAAPIQSADQQIAALQAIMKGRKRKT